MIIIFSYLLSSSICSCLFVRDISQSLSVESCCCDRLPERGSCWVDCGLSSLQAKTKRNKSGEKKRGGGGGARKRERERESLTYLQLS